MADLFQNKLNQYVGDVARSAKFSILMNPPQDLKLNISMTNNSKSKSELSGSQANEAIEYFCYAGAFPGITGESIDFKYFGRNIPIPSISIPNQTWTATFYNDENHEIRQFFKDWIQKSQYANLNTDDLEQREMGSYSDGYNSWLALYQYDYQLKNKTAVYALFNPFPVSMSDIEVSYENLNQVQSFTVEFRYTHFEIGFIEGNGASVEDIKSLVSSSVKEIAKSAMGAVKDFGKNTIKSLYSGANEKYGIEKYINNKRDELKSWVEDRKKGILDILKN